MNHKTHNVVGLVVAEVVLISFKQPPLTVVTAAGLIGGYFHSILADIDDSDAKIAQHQPFRAFSLLFERLPFVTHRGITHSLFMLAVLYFLYTTVIPLPEVLVWCFVGSYASHILIDMLTAEGVEILYPFKKRIKLVPYFLAASGDEDDLVQMIFFTLFSLVFYFLLIHMSINLLSFTPFIGAPINQMWDSHVVSLFPDPIRSWLFYY